MRTAFALAAPLALALPVALPVALPLALPLALGGCARTDDSSAAPSDAAQPSAPASAPAAPAAANDPWHPLPQGAGEPPKFKPSSRMPAPQSAITNAYGAFGPTPNAPGVGDEALDFTAALADGGSFTLSKTLEAGPVLLMFYRGFW